MFKCICFCLSIFFTIGYCVLPFFVLNLVFLSGFLDLPWFANSWPSFEILCLPQNVIWLPLGFLDLPRFANSWPSSEYFYVWLPFRIPWPSVICELLAFLWDSMPASDCLASFRIPWPSSECLASFWIPWPSPRIEFRLWF